MVSMQPANLLRGTLYVECDVVLEKGATPYDGLSVREVFVVLEFLGVDWSHRAVVGRRR